MIESPPDPMADALAAVSYVEDPFSDALDTLHPTDLDQAKRQLSAAVLVAWELVNVLADYLNGDIASPEHELGTQEWADQYARREETRRRLLEIMRQHVAGEFKPQGGQDK